MMKIANEEIDVSVGFIKMTAEALRLGLMLDNGRHYLMSTTPENITIEDCLEAFGFTKEGFEKED